jgi:hypothetical protein
MIRNAQSFQVIETTQYDTIMMESWHCTLYKTIEPDNIKSEPWLEVCQAIESLGPEFKPSTTKKKKKRWTLMYTLAFG